MAPGRTNSAGVLVTTMVEERAPPPPGGVRCKRKVRQLLRAVAVANSLAEGMRLFLSLLLGGGARRAGRSGGARHGGCRTIGGGSSRVLEREARCSTRKCTWRGQITK